MSFMGTFTPRILSRSIALVSMPTSSALHRSLSIDLPTNPISGQVSMNFEHGLPTIYVPLPSRGERCQFTLKPISHTVNDLCTHIKNEDKGAEIVAIYTTEGHRISSSTPIEHLLRMDKFHLRINDTRFVTDAPKLGSLDKYSVSPTSYSTEQINQLGDVRSLVASLHATLNVDEHQIEVERELLKELEELKIELMPLEKMKLDLTELADRRTTRLLWGGLGLMGIQMGAFARLTWWEYSWDIMEPVTYFSTFATVVGSYCYFLLTRASYEYHEAGDRIYLTGFHKGAKKLRFDVTEYNKLKEAITAIEHDLKRLRDPFYLHLPLNRLRNVELREHLKKAIDALANKQQS